MTEREKRYTIKTVAEMLHVSDRTVRRWIDSSLLPARQGYRNIWYVTDTELKWFIKEHPERANPNY